MTKLRNQHHFKTNQHSTPEHVAGFGMAEALVAASAGVLLISASTLALRSTGNLINKMQTKSELQQNTTSGAGVVKRFRNLKAVFARKRSAASAWIAPERAHERSAGRAKKFKRRKKGNAHFGCTCNKDSLEMSASKPWTHFPAQVAGGESPCFTVKVIDS